MDQSYCRYVKKTSTKQPIHLYVHTTSCAIERHATKSIESSQLLHSLFADTRQHPYLISVVPVLSQGFRVALVAEYKDESSPAELFRLIETAIGSLDLLSP